jgi:hypothetical protein
VVCQGANPEKTNRGLGPPIRVLHIGRYGGVAGSATVEENSTIPPSPHVVKGLEACGRRNCDQGSRIARSRSTAALMRGRSKAKRLERAIREAHNRFRRPIKANASYRSFTGRMRHDVALVGPAEAETAWRERPTSVAAGEITDRVRSRGRSRHGCPLCRRAEGSVAVTVRLNAPLGYSASK